MDLRKDKCLICSLGSFSEQIELHLLKTHGRMLRYRLSEVFFSSCIIYLQQVRIKFILQNDRYIRKTCQQSERLASVSGEIQDRQLSLIYGTVLSILFAFRFYSLVPNADALSFRFCLVRKSYPDVSNNLNAQCLLHRGPILSLSSHDSPNGDRCT